MKILFTIFLFSVFLFTVKAQKIAYAYDAAGNRVNREIILNRAINADDVTEEYFTDLVDKRQITIYPNPTHGNIKIEFNGIDSIENCTISVFSTESKLLLVKEISLPITELDISNQPNGVYIMIVEINNEKISWKIIKK